MDRYAAQMIARGPTPTGSVHVVDLPRPAAARAFAFDEPSYLVLGTGPAPVDRDEPIAYRPLLSDDGDTWPGTAALLQAPDRDTARAVRPADRYAAADDSSDLT